MTALTPAQVRDHARALIENAMDDLLDDTMGISESLEDVIPSGTDAEIEAYDATVSAIADAIRTARITVDWDEEGPA